MTTIQSWRNAAGCMIFAASLLLAGCANQAAPPPVVAAVASPAPSSPDPAAVHKAFEAGYAAGYAAAKRMQARLDEQLKPQPGMADASQTQPNEPATSTAAVGQLNNFAIGNPTTGTADAPGDIFQQAGQAIPVGRGN
jgi:phage tail tape-measure protein